MTDFPAAPRSSWRDWLPAISVAVLLVGAMLTGGGYLAQLKDNTRRIEQLETDSRANRDLLSTIDVRTARTDTKMDMLIDADRPRKADR